MCLTTKVLNYIYVFSGVFLYIFAIYTNIVFLYIHKAYSDNQPTTPILIFIIELIGLILLFNIQLTKFSNKNSNSSVCCLIVGDILTFGVINGIKIIGYIEAYNFVLNKKEYNPHNYDALWINLIISTLLHSSCALLNLIISIINLCCEEKKSTYTIEHKPVENKLPNVQLV
jgi:hypothetical protein